LRPSLKIGPIHPTTWVAALTLAASCVAGSLFVGEKAAHYLPDKIVISSWQPPRLPRDATLAPEPSQTSNLAKKAAREPFRKLARVAPGIDAGEPWALPETGAPDGGGTIEENGSAEQGRASWYDLETPTASGERLDDEALTAAHRSYPFGTRLRVTNLDNGREVVVRVNDRGPFAKNRIIDLSKAAAQELGMIKTGVADVSVTPVTDAFASAGDGAGG
jgi:rare lipoprotein A